MEKEEIKQYAEKKVLEALSSAIETAYNDGYKAGYNDGVSGQESSVQEEVNEGVEYIDLNLPSGTKWSSSYIKDKNGYYKYLSYDEADKLNIPTYEQFYELMKCCKKVYNLYKSGSNVEMVGSNSNAIKLYYGIRHEGSLTRDQGSFLFWLKDNREENEKNNNIDIATGDECQNKNLYKGFKIPVMLVK